MYYQSAQSASLDRCFLLHCKTYFLPYQMLQTSGAEVWKTPSVAGRVSAAAQAVCY